MMPGLSTVRSIASSSTGGPRRSPRPGAPSAANSPTRQRDQRQRHDPEQPRGAAGGPALPGGGAARLHQVTSKNPCQPSSVNSDWWAWNMKRPAVGKRHSRIPRWPWHSITVSVSSDGFSAVPVGM